MSGGHFSNSHFVFLDFASELEDEIETNTKLDEYGYSVGFTAETLKLLSDSRRMIEVVGKLVKRIDWLYSGDIGEETAQEEIPLLLNEILAVLEIKEKYEF